MKPNTHKTIIRVACILIPACIIGNPAINNSWTPDGMSFADSTTAWFTFFYSTLMIVGFVLGGLVTEGGDTVKTSDKTKTVRGGDISKTVKTYKTDDTIRGD